MSFVPALIAGLGGLGGLFGNQSKTATTTQNQNQQGGSVTSGGGSQFSNSTNNLNPLASGGLYNTAGLYDQLNAGTDLTGYQAGQTSQINKNAQTQQQSIIDNMAMHGITSGPALAAALSQNDSTRMGNITQLNQQIPLLQNQLLQTTATNEGNFYKGIPLAGTSSTVNQNNTTGQNTWGSGQMQGTQTSPGNMLGGLFSGLGTTLAGLFGQGAFSNWGGGGGGNNVTPTTGGNAVIYS